MRCRVERGDIWVVVFWGKGLVFFGFCFRFFFLLLALLRNSFGKVNCINNNANSDINSRGTPRCESHSWRGQATKLPLLKDQTDFNSTEPFSTHHSPPLLSAFLPQLVTRPPYAPNLEGDHLTYHLLPFHKPVSAALQTDPGNSHPNNSTQTLPVCQFHATRTAILRSHGVSKPMC